jgi:hypothetical protein
MDKVILAIVGVIGVFISFQQWRTNERSRKQTFFDKRLAVHNDITNIITDINIMKNITDNSISAEHQDLLVSSLTKCLSLSRQSKFLFNDQLHKKLEELTNEISNNLECHKVLLTAQESNKKEDQDAVKIFQESYLSFIKLTSGKKEKELEDLFCHYLKVEHRWEDELLDCIKSFFAGIKSLFKKLWVGIKSLFKKGKNNEKE